MGAVIDKFQSFENAILYSALETARIGLCAINVQGDIVILTSEFARKLGQDPSDLLGRSARRMLSAAPFSVANFAELIDLNATDTLAQAAFNQDGKLTVLLFHGSTTFHPGFGKYRVISIHDIEDFGVTPTQLMETRRQIEAMGSAVVITDLGHPDHPIVGVNHRFEEMTGYPAAEVLGRNCRFLQGPNREQPGLQKLRAAMKALQPCRVILLNYRRNGESFLNELFVTPIFDARGSATHCLGLQREFSPRQLEL